MDRTVFQDLVKNAKIQEFLQLIKEGQNLVSEELWDGAKAFILSQIKGKHLLILTEDKPDKHLFSDLHLFTDTPIVEFPAFDSLPSNEIFASPDVVGERYRVLDELLQNKQPHIVLTTLQAFLQKVPKAQNLQSLMLVLKKGTNASFADFPTFLTEMGYHKASVASDKGTFAVRGGIIDVFPSQAYDPYRIEFWEDEISSIRKYDPISQLSIEKVDQITITPNEEIKSESVATLLDYLGKETICVFDDLFALEDKAVSLQKMASLDDILKLVEPFQKIFFVEETLETLTDVTSAGKSKVNVYSEKAPAYDIAFNAFNKKLKAKRWHHPFWPVFGTFCPPGTPFEQFSADALLKEATSSQYKLYFVCKVESEKSKVQDVEGTIIEGMLSNGFCLKEDQIALIPISELFHKSILRRNKHRSSYTSSTSEFFAIEPGSAIVHMNSGIGRYVGVEKRPNHLGVDTEFLIVEYADAAKLYVPIEQTHLISKYIGASEQPPELHTLGSSKWKNALQKSEKAVQGYAQDLLALQAERALRGGFAYPPHSGLVKQFSEEFPYVETPDQMSAIVKVYEDMMSPRSMDRLVCGDVGYGKTEVAMRAAFKAVTDGGKQVAVLVPTTVLAMQHFETFSERMKGFPITLGLLSRFRTPKEQKKTIEDIADGKVDIVIGTHRIIGEDILFKDLGLVIIDEEQRFGVKAKEHLKKLKKEVDCLTLSATPIPRTLYLSLSGAREMSVIATPPEDRLPIQTNIVQSSDEVIKNALLRELTRDGQAYVIHNRVETIFEYASRIQKLLPEARIVVGHGQMSSSELDTVFHAFKNGTADILVATSIIENGIDIANANTILIDRADRFGMADLYQMRGRVGRWNKKAYCFFMVPNTLTLNEISRKRLSALIQSSGYGGGMKVAMHDLEIRGAGNILGLEQSGHIASIGFTLYCKLLKKAINALQKKGSALPLNDVKMEFPYDARLPENYVPEITLRMEFYQRLAEAETNSEIDLIMNELVDRFGPLPPEVVWLQSFAKIRLFAALNQFTLIKLTKVVLLAEQNVGKKQSLSKKVMINLPKTAEELENTVINSLKTNFPMP